MTTRLANNDIFLGPFCSVFQMCPVTGTEPSVLRESLSCWGRIDVVCP